MTGHEFGWVPIKSKHLTKGYRAWRRCRLITKGPITKGQTRILKKNCNLYEWNKKNKQWKPTTDEWASCLS